MFHLATCQNNHPTIKPLGGSRSLSRPAFHHKINISACALNVIVKVIGAAFGYRAFQEASEGPNGGVDGDYHNAPGPGASDAF